MTKQFKRSLNIRRTKIKIAEEIHNLNIDNEDSESVKDVLTFFQSMQMETAAKKSREGWDSERQRWENWERSPRTNMYQ